MMAQVWFCLVILMVSMVSQSSVCCSTFRSVLYVQLEEALVNDAVTLEQLREVFFAEPQRPNEINFDINIMVESIPVSNCSVCSWYICEPAFCSVNKNASHYGNTSTAQWELCSHLNIVWTTGLDAVEIIEALANAVVPWCAHGLSIMVLFNGDRYVLDMDGWRDYYIISIDLLLKTLTCQPNTHELTDVVGEFFTWVSVNLILIHVVCSNYV